MRLKQGILIEHKKKRYAGDIPDSIFYEIYGKDNEKAKKKFEYVAPSRLPKSQTK